MDLRFNRDPESGLPHFFDHGVTEEEVLEVLLRRGEIRRGSEDSWVKIGQTSAGRYLKVVYVPQETGELLVVTAFEIRGNMLKAFRRRQRRKHR